MQADLKRDDRTEKFLDNIERLIPEEIARCFGVRIESSGNVVLDEKRGLGALVGGCVLIAAALDIASSAAKGLKWSDYKNNERKEAMKEWVINYLPSKYRAINWYNEFRNSLVHNFCPIDLELSHLERFRPRHLKEVQVKGKQRLICVHIFQLLEDLNEALRAFAKETKANPELYKCVRRYARNYPVLERRNPD